MRINLLPNGDKNKKDDSKEPKNSAVHEVPMSTPIPLDKSIVSEPVDLFAHSENDDSKGGLKVPVARKYTTIETESSETEKQPIVQTQRNIGAPKYVRDRSGRKLPVVFAPRRMKNLSEPIQPKDKVKLSYLPHGQKKSEPDKMSETVAQDLNPSAKENLLEQFRRAKPTVETKPLPPNPEVPIVNNIKTTLERKVLEPKPVASNVKRQSVKNETPMFLMLVLVGLFIGAGLWWGILYWHDSEASALTSRAQELSTQVSLSQLDSGAASRLQAQLNVLESWFGSTLNYDHIFPLLEDTVLENISYTAINTFNTDTFNLSGVAPDSYSVAQQYLVFQERSDVSSVKILEMTEKDEGSLEFTFVVNLNEQNAEAFN